MKILHYALGFPPYRTGGLTKYCLDLMMTQTEQGHDVALLWPGRMGLINRKLKIKQGKKTSGIDSFEIINPLPVSLDEGIQNTKAFMAVGDKNIFISFLKQFCPNAIHIHTLMGLHKEFIESAKELNIKTIFTTHDYYGICPKVTLFRNGKVCDFDQDCRNCVSCNQSALSLKKLRVLQGPFYRMIKDTVIIEFLRKKHRSSFFEKLPIKETVFQDNEIEEKSKRYIMLRKYYIDILESINLIHFNSTVSKKIYERYITPQNSKLINITHRGIADHRKVKEFDYEKINITYLAPTKPYKGFHILKQALDELWNEGYRNFELNIFNQTKHISPYMNIQNGYQYSELENIFDETDILVAPSICYETFGFTVLEALSYGVPVLISENVGAKDIVRQYTGVVITDINIMKLKEEIILILTNDKLQKMNRTILERMEIMTVQEMTQKINECYKIYKDSGESQ